MGIRALVEDAEAAAKTAPDGGSPRFYGARWAAISSALVAYAAGDAFGVPYEFQTNSLAVDTSTIGSRPDWPRGGVSDDTLLSLLTIAAITPRGAQASADRFLDDLRQAIPHLRGLGPTTRAALGLPVPDAESHLVGNTNGAMMRTALVGLAFDPRDDRPRRDLVHALARATHKARPAVICAVLASKLFSIASAGGSPSSLRTALSDEADQLTDVPADASEMITTLDTWSAPVDGVSLNPVETLAAVVTIATESHTCLDAYRAACELGGDTDTVSALAAALVAARDPRASALFDIPWLDDVQWDEIPQMSSAMVRLSGLRLASEASQI